MMSRFFALLATALFIGCGSDESPVVEVGDTGQVPVDGTADDTIVTTDTGAVDDTGGTVDETGGDTGVPSETGGDTGASDAPASTTSIKCAATTCDSKTQECCIVG